MPEPAIEIVQDVTPELVEAMAGLLPQLSRSAPAPTAEELAEIVDGDATSLLVALLDGRIVGSLTLVVFRIPTGVRAWIEDVVVDASARGAGVGEALNRAALAEAQRRGARTVDLTSRPSREAANRLYQRLGFVAPGDQRLPLGLNATPSGRELVLGGLADLPVTIGGRPGQCLVDLGPVEGRQGDDGAAPDGRPCPQWRQGWPEGPAGSPMAPSAATAASRTRASSCPAARAHRRATTAAPSGSSRRPCSPQAKATTSTTVGSSSSSAARRDTARSPAASSAARRRTLAAGVGERGLQQRAVEPTHAPERSERGRPHGGLLVGQRVQGTADVPLVPGQRRAPPTLRCAGRPWRPGAGVHDRPARSVRAATTSTATTIASSAPRMTPMTPSPVNAKRRFQMGVRRYSIVGSSTTTMVSSG